MLQSSSELIKLCLSALSRFEMTVIKIHCSGTDHYYTIIYRESNAYCCYDHPELKMKWTSFKSLVSFESWYWIVRIDEYVCHNFSLKLGSTRNTNTTDFRLRSICRELDFNFWKFYFIYIVPGNCKINRSSLFEVQQ